MLSAPLSVLATILLLPVWSWLESSAGIEAVGHSGPAAWCYFVTFAFSSARAFCFSAHEAGAALQSFLEGRGVATAARLPPPQCQRKRTRTISYDFAPLGVITSAESPTDLPISARASGAPIESRPALMSASSCPTI